MLEQDLLKEEKVMQNQLLVMVGVLEDEVSNNGHICQRYWIEL